MKNKHIKNLKEVVPAELRLEVYRETLEFIKNNPIGTHNRVDLGAGLCVLVPSILWGLDSAFDCAPDGEDWCFSETRIAFPEISNKVVVRISEGTLSPDREVLRIEVLEEIILNWK